MKKIFSIMCLIIFVFTLNGCKYEGNSIDKIGGPNFSPNNKVTILNEQINLHRNGYEVYDYYFYKDTTLYIQTENLSSNVFEIFIFTEIGYSQFQMGRPTGYDSVTVYKMYNDTKIFNLTKGKYYIVMDYTDYGTICPTKNPVEFKVKVSHEYKN